MIAISFLDAVKCDCAANGDRLRRTQVAETYIESALADWERVLECERHFGSMEFATPNEQSKVNHSLYEVYQKWAAESEQVLVRARHVAGTECWAAHVEALEDAFGRVQARLKMTPEMFDRSMQQIREGRGIPMEELRNELRARIRA